MAGKTMIERLIHGAYLDRSGDTPTDIDCLKNNHNRCLNAGFVP
jgi:hypothetical protein